MAPQTRIAFPFVVVPVVRVLRAPTGLSVRSVCHFLRSFVGCDAVLSRWMLQRVRQQIEFTTVELRSKRTIVKHIVHLPHLGDFAMKVGMQVSDCSCENLELIKDEVCRVIARRAESSCRSTCDHSLANPLRDVEPV